MFNKYGKKVLSLALASAMSASLMAPAFAADGNTTEVSATYQDVKIAVTVPSTGEVYINPYGLPVEIGTGSNGAVKSTAGDQIVTKPLYIANDGADTDLEVGVSVTTTLGKGTMSLATAAIADKATETKKTAFVYFEIAKDTTLSGEKGTAVTDAKIVDAYKAVTWQQAYGDTNKTQLLLKAGATQTQSDTSIALTKATAAATEAKGNVGDNDYQAATPVKYAAGSIAFFRLAGTVAQAPKDAWTEKDTFTTTIAFTFVPKTGT
jgi:hypothetical protein